MPAKKRMSKFAAISCTHCPFQNTQAIESLLGRLSGGGPYGGITDFVMLGDLFESSAASVHPDEHAHSLSDEYESAASLLASIRDVLPKSCNFWWLHGNHDDNLQVGDSRRTDKRTRDLIHWSRSEWGEEFNKWRQRPYLKPSIHNQTGCLEIGQVIFLHGFDAGQNSDELEGLQAAYACGGHAHRLVIRGHTHRPRHVTQCKRSAKVLLPYWYSNAGSLGPLQPPYMQRKDVSQWLPAVVWGEAKVDSPSRFTGVEWQAHTEILY